MEQSKNKEQGGAASTVPTEKKNESRKREVSGKDNERLTADNAQGHRLNRAFGLLERVAEFCDKRQLVTVNKALLSIAVNAMDISRAVSSLDKRPAPGQPFSGNTNGNGANK